ncbi:hypothetical protein [Niameybacter massiliensis]|uniref:hypothetical protein n=1 Tax=Niameybacter massiliensis TaxID=1658108 RepID=UPI0006B43B8D|nr:hypothetical protein [Niameybacter massiliensis]
MNKEDFAKFLLDDRLEIEYDNKVFTKNIKGALNKIKIGDELIYEVHTEKKLLIVVEALYCTFNRDAYWDVAKLAQLEEVIADPHTLVRI